MNDIYAGLDSDEFDARLLASLEAESHAVLVSMLLEHAYDEAVEWCNNGILDEWFSEQECAICSDNFRHDDDGAVVDPSDATRLVHASCLEDAADERTIIDEAKERQFRGNGRV